MLTRSYIAGLDELELLSNLYDIYAQRDTLLMTTKINKTFCLGSQYAK